MNIAPNEVEDLLFLEAELLDAWRLDEWLDLYTDEATYLVPSPGMPPDCSPDTSLFLVNDDRSRMENRVKRLQRRTAHSEYPHSTTVHMLGNLRIAGPEEDGVAVHGTFHVSRFKDGVTDVFVGRARYRLVRREGALRIDWKRCDLAMDALVPQGRLTIIL